MSMKQVDAVRATKAREDQSPPRVAGYACYLTPAGNHITGSDVPVVYTPVIAEAIRWLAERIWADAAHHDGDFHASHYPHVQKRLDAHIQNLEHGNTIIVSLTNTRSIATIGIIKHSTPDTSTHTRTRIGVGNLRVIREATS